ncbi:hypothetical protein GCL60_09940 [Silvanigrella paludirubra]|uniref:Uncharacterized protein n=1 Tax=Silvanigrella paludirubra TaxID=2499159 RepID=A0A6N6VSR6_9BACT|nr:hypothetical protein [Silvanigrella paludirubra]KAB8039167.1 hypothetical protein GCL60_09940 [Silvanigrella paludirubra]
MTNVINLKEFKKRSKTLWLKRDKQRKLEGRAYNYIDANNLILDVDPDIIKRMKKILKENLEKEKFETS